MKFIHDLFERVRPHFEKGGKFHTFWPVFDAIETPVLTSDAATERGSHVRDNIDLKRIMIFVDYALLPAILFGCWNIGYQSYFAEGAAGVGHLDFFLRGLWHFLPMLLTVFAAGAAAEVLFAVVRGHEIHEGFLVTLFLIPLTMAPTTPLWIVALGTLFGIVIGKEVFGGVGMNILNPALTARAFVFFAYPASLSGAKDADNLGVWNAAGRANPFGASVDAQNLVAQSGVYGTPAVDGFTGATPLLAVANGGPGERAIDLLAAEGWTWYDLFFGFIPGSMGETSTFAVLIGAVFLIATGVASLRVMLGCVAGLLAVTSLFYYLSPVDAGGMLSLPPWYHLVMGGFAFGAVFMATDPVSSAVTPVGRILFGFGVGVLAGLVRIANPAYPEGVMLAILFMNVFAPLIDYFVVKASTRRRRARLASGSVHHGI